jgi:hypothetical protein
MSDDTPVADPGAAAQGGFFANLMDLYFAPRDAFARILPRPTFLLPLMGHIVLALGFTLIWTSQMEPREFMKTQLQESGQWDKMEADQREQVVEMQSKFVPIMAPTMAVLGTPIFVLILAAVLMFIFRFFYAGAFGFKVAMAITSWTLFAVALLTTPLTLAVLWLKEDWNLDPGQALQANLSLLLEKAETAKPLWALVTSLDLVSLWMVFLLASGFGVACRKATGSAIWGVAIPWAILILLKVGWSAIF